MDYRHPQEQELKETLLPCPHCGAKAELRSRELRNDGGARCSYLVCCSDDCSGQTAYRVNLPTAVKMWNKRTPPPQDKPKPQQDYNPFTSPLDHPESVKAINEIAAIIERPPPQDKTP